MLNQKTQNDLSLYSILIPVFYPPELLHDSFSNIISYVFTDPTTVYDLKISNDYTMLISLTNFFSYDFANYYATSFYRLYTNKYCKTIYGPVLIFSHNDSQSIPYLLLEEMSSLTKIYK